MRLEVGSIHVRDVQLDGSTELRDHVLTIDARKLRDLVLDDPHFADARVRVVKPGESVRIIHALDVVEPRWKVAGPGGIFPRDLNFLGCIVFGGVTASAADKEACSSAASKLARLVGAEAALVIGLNGSNHAVDLMLAIQKCERAGIKTTLVYNDVGDGPDDPGFIFAVPEADAIVNAGCRAQKVALPKMETIIGGEHLVDPEMDARGELTVPVRYLHGAVDPSGHSRLTVRFE